MMMAATMVRPAWQNPRVVTTIMLVFLAGAASGALSMQFGLHSRLHHALSTPAPVPGREALLQRFNSELGLSQDQSQKISVVLADYTQYIQSLQDQLDDMRATGRAQILEILNPDQKERFKKIMSELEPGLDEASSK
jgi:hypothetical protein